MSMQNVGIALTGDDRQLLQILQQMEGHLKSLNTVAQKAMGGTAAVAEEAARAFRQVEQAASGSADAVAQAGRAMSTYTAMSRDARVEANLLRQANRQMAMQMTDVVTSLASGMPLWMVFIQQGGQIKDAYGGVGQALSGVAGYLRTLINPVTAVIAVLGAVAAAAKIASNQFQDANKHVVLTGEAAGVTAGQMMVMANSITEVAGSRGQALEALKALSGAAGVGAEDMGRFALAAIQMARAGGPAIEETARKFVDLGNKPLETLIKLNEKENFLTDSVYRSVRALQEQGREAEAAKLAQQAYLAEMAKRTTQMESELDNLDRALRAVGQTARDVANWVLQIFEGSSLEERIADMRRLLQRLETDAPPKDSNPQFEALHKANMDRARSELKALEDQLAARNKLKKAEQEDKDRARALAAWDAKQADYLSEQAKHEAKIAQIRKQAEAAGAATDARVAAERDERIRIETERFQQAQARQQADDGAAMLQRLQLENLLLDERIKLGRDLNQGEEARIRLNEAQRLGKVDMTDETNAEVRAALIEGDSKRREIKAAEDAKKTQEATDEAKRKAADDERKQRERRIADLQAEYDKQAQVVQGVEDETLAIIRGKEALDAEKDARELRRAAGLRDRAAIIESLGTQTEESTLMVRIAEQIEQEVAARQRLRKQQEDQAARKAALALAEEERKERERALADMDRELEAGDKVLQGLRNEILATDDSKAAVRDNTAARLDNAAAMLEQHAATLESFDATNTEAAKIRERAAQLREEAKLRRDLTRALDDKAVRDANARAAREAAAQWERTVDQVGQSLADALMNGGKSAGDALKRYFQTLILQPIIRAVVDPVARVFMGMLGFGGAAGTAAAGTAAAGTAAAGASAAGAAGGMGSASGLAGLIASGGSIFSAGASAGMAGNIMGGFSSAGSMLSAGATTQGLAMGAGTLAGMVAPAMIGQMIGRGISGGYSAIGGRSGSSAVNLGTGIGALFGPIGAGIGAAVGGLVNRAFGTKVADTGVQGTFGPAGFAGGQYTYEKGGWFRSNRFSTNPLSEELQSVLGDGFMQLREDTIKMAQDMGMASDAVLKFNKAIKISFKGLTEEEIQQKLAKELGLVADEMARLAGGAGTTADSLRQLYQQVMSERAQLETQLLQLQGDTAELRRRERDALHESNRALYDRLVALEDERAAAEAASQALRSLIQSLQSDLSAAESQRLSIAQQVISERTALEDRLLQAQGRTAELQARQIATLDPLNQAFARFVAAAEATAQRLQALAQAGQGIAAFVATLRGGAAGGSARSIYASTLSRAQAGDIEASGQITGAAQAYLDAATATARSSAEARVLRARIASELEGLPATQTWQAQQAAALQAIASNTSSTGALNTTTGTVADATEGALAENEKQVAELRKLVTETIINSTRLGTLNASIESLTGELRAASERERVAAQVQALQAQGQGAAADLQRLGGVYETSRTAALQSYINTYRGGTPLSVLEMGLPAGAAPGSAEYLQHVAGQINRWNEITVGLSNTRLELPTLARTLQPGMPGYQARLDPTPGSQSVQTAIRTALDSMAYVQMARDDVERLREQIRNLGGVPQFAMGGLHSGGLRIVGERGPELEATGPARYWSAADTTAMLSNGQRREELLAAEIRALRAEVQGLRAEARVTAVATNKVQRLWERVTRDGESMQIVDVTPTP